MAAVPGDLNLAFCNCLDLHERQIHTVLLPLGEEPDFSCGGLSVLLCSDAGCW